MAKYSGDERDILTGGAGYGGRGTGRGQVPRYVRYGGGERDRSYSRRY
jgi:hypothetical protein